MIVTPNFAHTLLGKNWQNLLKFFKFQMEIQNQAEFLYVLKNGAFVLKQFVWLVADFSSHCRPKFCALSTLVSKNFSSYFSSQSDAMDTGAMARRSLNLRDRSFRIMFRLNYSPRLPDDNFRTRQSMRLESSIKFRHKLILPIFDHNCSSYF